MRKEARRWTVLWVSALMICLAVAPRSGAYP
jgi:hypothetical protein